jgi:3-deoxy-7-phosphoheptulonate synthase
MQKIQNVRIRGAEPLITPRELKMELPLTPHAAATVLAGRKTIENILTGRDDRVLVVIGPCSIHDVKAAFEYAERLLRLRVELNDVFSIVMRTYFEKPRTTIGWKGLINDPYLDNSTDMTSGLRFARRLLLDCAELGIPTATEFLDPFTPQFIDDLVSWAAIGARTTESQTHRTMASGLSMPVGFKNGTDGSLQVALDAMSSAKHPHSFIGIDEDGRASVVRTTGNPLGHIVLRGGSKRTNYDSASIEEATARLREAELPTALMVDCSHANSGKVADQQEMVWQCLVAQLTQGCPSLIGIMIESHLHGGKQSIPPNLADLKYGVSITDECIGWELTEKLLRSGAEQLRSSRLARHLAFA